MKYLVSVVACCLLSACSFGDADVEFTPEKGEERSYQLYSTTNITVDNGQRTETVNTSSHQLLRYKVLETGKNSRFQVHVDYMNMRDGQGSGVSSGQRADRNPEMHAIFSQGFEFTLNLDDGSVKEFSALNKPVWQALLAERGAELKQELKKLFSSSAFLSTIPAKAGAVVALPTYQGHTNAKLTVLQVTDTHVLAKVESDGEQAKIYGQLMLERERGWLAQLALVAEAPFERYGYKGTVRSNVIMLPQQRQLGDLTQRLGFDYDFPAFEYQKQPDFVLDDINKTLGIDAVFAYDAGYFNQQDDLLNLTYHHDFSGFKPEGGFSLTDITAHSADGTVLPLQLSKVGSYSYPEQDGFHQSVQQNLLIGWNAPNDLLAQVAEFRATAHYHGAKLVKLNLTPDPNKTVSLQYEDLQLELSPITDKPFSYLLKSRGGADKMWLYRRYDGAEGAMVHYLPPPATGPDWLTSAEQNMLALTSSAQYETITQFTFAAAPSTLTLYVNTAADSGELTKNIRFIPTQDYAQNVAYPPAQQQLLYSDDMYASYDNQPQPSTPADPALLEPQIVAKYGVSMLLTSEQAAVCTLSVVDAPKVNGHTLQWTNTSASSNTGFGAGLDKFVQYQLSSADGIRRNFYDIKVSSTLACTGTPKWQALAYQPEQSWLIDITQLPNLDATQTVADVMRRYRFLNAQNLPLAPAIQDYGSDFYQRPLQQVLREQRWFVLAGRAAKIEQLTISGEPVNKQWVNIFPALP
ncbi:MULTISPECIES: hypothetical protein [Shewanella]|uniref:hypothetical protein n=1 Tax=Shewanella TaxID=22 RepID=UPI000D3C589B|nr:MULTISPECIES: hypothetical protein [Shewanella]MCI2962941.1 hypothetical protein [Shewanella sp. N2AIL]